MRKNSFFFIVFEGIEGTGKSYQIQERARRKFVSPYRKANEILNIQLLFNMLDSTTEISLIICNLKNLICNLKFEIQEALQLRLLITQLSITTFYLVSNRPVPNNVNLQVTYQFNHNNIQSKRYIQTEM